MVGNLIRLVDSMIMCPQLYFPGCAEAILWRRPWQWITHSVSPWTVVLQKHYMQEKKSINRINICTSKDKLLPFPWRKWSDVVILPLGCWLINLGMVLYLTFSVVFCCWKIRPSAGAVFRSEIVSRNLRFWAHEYPTSLPPWPVFFFMCPLSNERNRSGEKLTVHSVGHPITWLSYLLS